MSARECEGEGRGCCKRKVRQEIRKVGVGERLVRQGRGRLRADWRYCQGGKRGGGVRERSLRLVEGEEMNRGKEMRKTVRDMEKKGRKENTAGEGKEAAGA